MEMTADVQLNVPELVPLSHCLVHGDRETTHAAVVTDAVAMMEPDRVVVPHVDVAVVAVRDDELYTGVVSELTSQCMVHQLFEAVASFRRNPTLLGHAPVVPAVARNDETHVRVVEDVPDTRCDVFLALDDRLYRKKAVRLHQFVVNRARDEVTEQSQHQRVDRSVILRVREELHKVSEVPTHTIETDLLVELVESIDLPRLDHFFDVPVRCHRHRYCPCTTGRNRFDLVVVASGADVARGFEFLP